MTEIEQLAAWLGAARHAVAFTGAGISTESGIPDFRSPGGIWSKSRPVPYDQFVRSAAARHEYWRQKSIAHRDFASSGPNVGHGVLAEWEASGRIDAVLTQNIDGLHQIAGSRRVVELHGTARRVACLRCKADVDADAMVEQFLSTDRVPTCGACGGLLKHATISFGQSLDPGVLDEAVQRSRGADLFLAIGSSLVVQPAASLPRIASEARAKLVIINRDPTPLDAIANAVLHAPIGRTLTAVARCLTDDRADSDRFDPS